MKNEKRRTEVRGQTPIKSGEVGGQRTDPMGVQLEPEDKLSEALVYGCFVGLLVFFLAVVAAIIWL
jgi:hypothetical protein